jgi:hypothetical protein
MTNKTKAEPMIISENEFEVVDRMLSHFEDLTPEEHLRILRWSGIINENKELTREFGGAGEPAKDRRGLPTRF